MNGKFTGNTAKIALHVLAWIILIVLPQYLGGRYWGYSNLFTWWFFVNTGTYLVIFYVNFLFLVPRFYFTGKKLIYFASAIVLMVGIYYLTEIANETFFRRQRTERLASIADSSGLDTLNYARYQENPGRIAGNVYDSNRTANIPSNISRTARNRTDTTSVAGVRSDSARFYRGTEGSSVYGPPTNNDNDRGSRPPGDLRRLLRPFPFQVYNYALAAVFFTFFSLGLKVMERHARIEKRQKELEKEKLNSELALLKNQISPHFFFNTLNNIYALIAINTVDSQEAVLKLSKLMRYLLYESEQGKTQLSSEIEFMNNYIDLMRLRMSDKVTLSVRFPEQYENFSMPPLLFIPFIENAFKHGITFREKSYIEISMHVEKGKLYFQCMNSLGKKPSEEEGEQHNGIGLENVTKRLNLLFPNQHKLKIDQSEKEFQVHLEIDLKQYKS
ncbi:MAG: histidine kinase [Bacteroidales bacterium]|nr:histidine kinase [Bacteroidales bacterium]